jgi:hydrophobe/amphiphile efflux-3 (HAE3) family protein
MNALAELVTRYSKAVVVSCILFSGLAVYKALDIRFAFTLRTLFDYPGNPEVPVLNRYLDEFGDDGGFVAIILEAEDVFTPHVLRYLQRVSRLLEREPIFWRVRSLAVNHIPRGSGDDIITAPLFEQVPDTRKELQALRRAALDSDLVVPRLVSRDGKAALVAAEMRTPSCVASIDEQAQAVEVARRIVRQSPPPAGVQVQIGGGPVIETEIRRILVRDQAVFAGVAGLILVLVLYLLFGSLHGVLLPFSAVVLSLSWVLGLMALFGAEIDIVSNTTPTILLIYGLLDSIFVMSCYYQLVDERHDRHESARLTILRLGWPCLLTSVTTAVGFASFSVSSLPLMQRYGAFLAAGVLFAYLTSIVWLPAVLCLVPPPRHGCSRRAAFGLVNKAVDWCTRVALVNPRTVLLVGLAFLGASAVAATRAKIDVFYLKELPQQTPAMRANHVLTNKLAGLVRTSLTITGPPDSMLEPETLRRIRELQRWVKQQPLVRSVLSLSDLVAAMNQAFHGGDPRQKAIPPSKALVAQYLMLLDPATRGDFVRSDYSHTHLRVLSADVGSHEWHEFARDLRRRAAASLGNFRLALTGYAPASIHGQEVLVLQLLWGFVIAFASIAILVGIAFRSARVGFLSVIPNLLPATCCLALLGILDVSLRTGTALFLCVAVGIVYDNTIHFLTTIRRARATGSTMEEACREGYRVVGPPAVHSALLIAGGFGIFALSGFPILRTFGLLCVGVILVGLAADLLLTPALLRIAGERGLPGGPARGPR